LIAEGLALVDKRNEKRFQKMVKDYLGAQDSAKKSRVSMTIEQVLLFKYTFCVCGKFPLA
jgi:hypothetical protein